MDEQRPTRFDQRLLDHIEFGRNAEAKAMLTRQLAQTFTDQGTLLHHAVKHNNTEIARELIELGADVDRFGGDVTTPLVLAVLDSSLPIIEVLLEANANIELVDNNHQSALLLISDLLFFDSHLHGLFASRMRREIRTPEELAAKMINVGCTMYHAAIWGDVDLMKCMLDRGVDVDSRSFVRSTALHAAAELNRLNLVEWLTSNGADLNALDADGSSALALAVHQKNKDVVRMLLERGADANGANGDDVPLYVAYCSLKEAPDELAECAELLLRHGANFPNSKTLIEMFDFALDSMASNKGVNLLIEQLAILETLGNATINKSVMYSVDEKYGWRLTDFVIHFEQCLQLLKIEVFGRCLLLDLLTGSEHKMRLLVRKETFVSAVEKVCEEHKLKQLYSYYCNTMMKRIAKAGRAVKLEDEAIPVICKLFKSDYNQCYNFARGVVSYLNERDPEQLIQV